MPGHIRKRGKESWSVVIDLGRDPLTGRRRQVRRAVKGTKREAEAALVQLLHQRDSGIDKPPGRMLLGEYLEKWLQDFAEHHLAPATRKRYRELLGVHVIPMLGSVPLAKLRPLHVQECYAQVLAKGRSARTALHVHRVLREALQHGLRLQLLARNPADAVEPPRPERYQVPMLAPDEVVRLLGTAEETAHGALVHTALATGLRLGELLGLRWEDVDLQAGVLHVRQSLQHLGGYQSTFRQPKTHRSARPVSIPVATADRLRRHRIRQAEELLAAGLSRQDPGLVFTDALGLPIHHEAWRRSWRKIVERSGLAYLRFHDLRHVHASLLLQQGVHPKIVSERLGHSGIGITMDIYSHVLPGLQSQAVEPLGQLLSGATGRGSGS